MGKKSGSGMNIPDHLSIFWVKILKFFDADPVPVSCQTLDPRSGMEKIGSGINISDPQHC
jgi:hypothetical protein